MASVSSAIAMVRDKLTDLQRNIAAKENVIMDGRDIGTNILPNAELKIYLTASAAIRAKRRYDELRNAGEWPDIDKIKADIIKRVAEKRRAMVWYDSIADYYNGLLQVADMQMFFVEHSAGFHTVEPHKIWMEYTGDYYRMDTYYRKFHLCFLCKETLVLCLNFGHNYLPPKFPLMNNNLLI